MPRQQAAIDIHRHLFFRLLRAAGEEDDVVVRNVRELSKRGRSRIIAIGLCAVIFERTRDVHAFCRCAERPKPLGRFFVLRRDEIDLPRAAAATSGRMRR